MPTPDSYIIDIPDDTTSPITKPLIKGFENAKIIDRFRKVEELYRKKVHNNETIWPYGKIRNIQTDIEVGPVENPYDIYLSDQQILKIVQDIIKDANNPEKLMSRKSIEEQIKDGVLVHVRTASNDLGYIIGKYDSSPRRGGKTRKGKQRKQRKQHKTKKH
jgi:hypothetical protein